MNKNDKKKNKTQLSYFPPIAQTQDKLNVLAFFMMEMAGIWWMTVIIL